MAMRRVVVTGGNAGVGRALCAKLVIDDGCFVYMGSRSLERGAAALASLIEEAPECEGKIDLVQIDTTSDESVQTAAATIAHKLGPETRLYGIVNNAGAGFAHGASNDVVIDTNLFGPKRMCEAFAPLLDPATGRIVNVGSGAASMYMERTSLANRNALKSFNVTWPEIDEVVKGELADSTGDQFPVYGVSKAGLAAYTMILAREHPNLTSSCCSPGFIDTAMTTGMGATKTPEEGTFSIRHCLFAELAGNGFYYGSDGVRSPLTKLRNPGEPAYEGDE
eukprot:TRINITY_DN69645_c0_g1_i1.p1 TRINITY_DN69645_c0_g1~~TRINITY_DN69645_c0_g1_i1.p1  ORF type:complete len:279 (-),score=51.33 TRINITY_DN69645_c0_g1_i1:4-840(-)